MRWRLFVLALVAVLATPTAAPARTTNPVLNEVTAFFAVRTDVSVRCYGPDEKGSPEYFGAWGYVKTPLARASKSHLDDTICEGALGVNDPELPAWQRALGVSVVVHEAWHLRRWRFAGNEAKVECQAIRHWRKGARLLGATPETLTELWPAALATHYELANYVSWMDGTRPYFDPRCEVPPLIDG